MYFLSFAFARGAVNLGFAGYFNFIFPSISPMIAAPVISVLITLLLLFGIQATGKINTFFSIIQVVSLFAIAGIALFSNPAGPFQYPEFLPNGWQGVFAATALIAPLLAVAKSLCGKSHWNNEKRIIVHVIPVNEPQFHSMLRECISYYKNTCHIRNQQQCAISFTNSSSVIVRSNTCIKWSIAHV